MATAGLERMMLWTDLEGRTVHGRWRLGRLVRPEGRTAWFEATDVDGKLVTVSITEALNDEDELLERFQAVSAIRHPNVVAIGESRISQIDETPIVVAAMEVTEENLSDVVRERTLSATEARQVLDAALAGLAAIHARGLVHGRMEAASVLAIGETIKLRSDCVHIGGAEFAAGAAEDVRGLGRVVTQAMTRRLPTGEYDPVLQLLPEAIARAVRRALSGNTTVAEMAALAGTHLDAIAEQASESMRIDPHSKTAPKGPMGPGIVIPAATEQRRAVSKVRENAEKTGTTARVVAMPAPAERTPGPMATAPEPVVETAAATLPDPRDVQKPVQGEILWGSPLTMEDDVDEAHRRPSTPYVIAAAVAVVLVTLFTLYGIFWHEPATPKDAPATAGSAVTQATPVLAPKVIVQPPPAVAEKARSAPQTGWRVVAYTYNFEAPAQHKVDMIAKQHPELEPAVFQPKSGSPYLVTLGGVMSRPEAIALRAKATKMGMPRDTYARNYR